MPEETLKKKTVNSAFWKIFEAGGSQAIQFIVSLVLARLVAPAQFSSIALTSIFLVIANVFVDSGFSSVLMRKSNRTQLDCCTVFYFNIVVAILAYLCIFVLSPLASKFYNLPELTIILRVMALSIIISSFSAIHKTLLTAELKFKELTICNIISLVISGIIGIILAFKGLQVWALVVQSLVNTLLVTILIIIKSSWRPSWEFSFKSLKEFFGIGSKLLASRLLDSLYSQIYGVVIGKVFPRADLAFYNRAHILSTMTTSVPTNTLTSVTFPVLCKLQGDDARLRDGYRRMIRLSAFIVFPLSLGIGAVSYPLINVLYSDVWIFSAALLQIIVFSAMWYPIHAINLNVLVVKGRTDLFFRLEVIKKVIGVLIMCFSIPLGLKAMCYGGIVSGLISLFINTYYTDKIIKYSVFTQLKDLFPSLALSVVMFVVCKLLSTALGNGLLSLSTSILTGVIIYAGGAILFRFPEFKELKNIRK